MLHPVLDRQFAHPRTIPLFRYNPDRAPFSLREWNPAAVGCAEDLPPYLILGKLDASSFEKSAGGWSARWQGTEEDTHFDVAYSAAECRWRISQKWQGVGGGYSFYDAQIPLGTVIAQTLYTKFPSNWERAAKQGLESEYQVNVMEQTEKSISLCTIPDGAPQAMVFPFAVSDLRTFRQSLQDSIERSRPIYPIDVEAKLVTHVINYIEGKAPEWTTRPKELFIKSLMDTGLIPLELPVREVASDGSAAWTLRREIYFLCIRVPFAGLTDFLARLSAESGPIRHVSAPELRFELRPLLMPAAVELQAHHLYLWDLRRTTRSFMQFASPDGVADGPMMHDATEDGWNPDAALERAETISTEVLLAMEQFLKQATTQ